jgi:putative transposase
MILRGRLSHRQTTSWQRTGQLELRRSSLRHDHFGRTPNVERIIGSIGRECLNHVIIVGEYHLRGVLSSYSCYYHKTRTHLSLDKDCPEMRLIHRPAASKIISFPEVGGLHHRYERRFA